MTQDHQAGASRRGAPYAYSEEPGLHERYPLSQTLRSTQRALALALEAPEPDGKKRKREIPKETLRQGQSKLAQTAAVQQLRVLAQPMIALHANPLKDKPRDWTWELLLPVIGQAKADEDAGISIKRIHGGAYVETVTTGGFEDLDNLYDYLIGKFLPEHKQELTRSTLYHRVMDGLGSDDRTPLTLAVYLPIVLSLRRPTSASE
ncbi:MAG: GyrI-like domain-containing protein [Deltaproteobacteria bacterium]|nr:GyrI-like domain-containing protein [Deltaproteobacteria bacterium]